MGEIIFLLLLVATAVIYIVQTLDYTTPLLDKSGGPAMFPQIVCGVLIVLILIRIIQILAQKNFKKFHFFELFKGSTGLFSISTIVMILLIQPLGFLITCFLYLTIVANALLYIKTKSFGKVWQIITREASFLAVVVGLQLFFTEVLYVAIPLGILKGLL